MDRCGQCDNDGMYRGRGKVIPCGYCLTGKLRTEIAQLQSEKDTLKNRIDSLLEVAEDLLFAQENKKFTDWCDENHEIIGEAKEVIIKEQALKEVKNDTD